MKYLSLLLLLVVIQTTAFAQYPGAGNRGAGAGRGERPLDPRAHRASDPDRNARAHARCIALTPHRRRV